MTVAKMFLALAVVAVVVAVAAGRHPRVTEAEGKVTSPADELSAGGLAGAYPSEIWWSTVWSWIWWSEDGESQAVAETPVTAATSEDGVLAWLWSLFHGWVDFVIWAFSPLFALGGSTNHR